MVNNNERMYNIILFPWLCLCLRAVVCDANVITSDTVQSLEQKNLEMAKVLHQILRKRVSGGESVTSSSKLSPATYSPAPVSRAATAETEEDDARRGFKTLTVRTQRQPSITPRPPGQKHPLAASLTPVGLATTARYDYPKHLNREKMEKLLSFLDKNQNRMKEFMKTARSEFAPAPTVPAAEETHAPLRTHASHVRAHGRDPRAPSPLQLDMAPAKGGRVHAMRIRNRLCHRHVLIPEGPKYNSHGSVYLGAHAGKDYAATRRPQLLLPRCCNCCKKSLLGCQ